MTDTTLPPSHCPLQTGRFLCETCPLLLPGGLSTWGAGMLRIVPMRPRSQPRPQRKPAAQWPEAHWKARPRAATKAASGPGTRPQARGGGRPALWLHATLGGFGRHMGPQTQTSRRHVFFLVWSLSGLRYPLPFTSELKAPSALN